MLFLFQRVLFELFIDYIFIYLFNCVIFQKIFDAIYKPAIIIMNLRQFQHWFIRSFNSIFFIILCIVCKNINFRHIYFLFLHIHFFLQSYLPFYWALLIIISFFFLILRTRKKRGVSWIEIKVNLCWWKQTWNNLHILYVCNNIKSQ